MRPREREQGVDAPPGLKGGGRHVGMTQRHRRWFRAPARCRSETGGQFSRSGPAVARHPGLWGSAKRREPSHRWGSEPPRPCGPLCRPEVGVSKPSPRFFAVCFCSVFAALRAAVGRHPAVEEYAPRREPSHGWGLNRRGPAGPLCRPEVGVPSRSRAFSLSFYPVFAALRAAVARHPGLWGSAPRGEPSHRWGLNRRGPVGRCAGPHRENWPDVGVPSGPPRFFRGSAIRAFRCAALRCYRTVSI